MYISSECDHPSPYYPSQWETAQLHLMKILFSSQEIKIIVPQINILPIFLLLVFLAVHMFSVWGRGG